MSFRLGAVVSLALALSSTAQADLLANLTGSSSDASAAACGSGAPAGWSFMGCYDWSNPSLTTSYSLADQPDVTYQTCSSKCDAMGSAYFGIANGYTCYCGTQLMSTPPSANANDCYYHCSGDDQQWCGGPNRIDLFSKGGAVSSVRTSTVAPTSTRAPPPTTAITSNVPPTTAPRTTANPPTTQQPTQVTTQITSQRTTARPTETSLVTTGGQICFTIGGGFSCFSVPAGATGGFNSGGDPITIGGLRLGI